MCNIPVKSQIITQINCPSIVFLVVKVNFKTGVERTKLKSRYLTRDRNDQARVNRSGPNKDDGAKDFTPFDISYSKIKKTIYLYKMGLRQYSLVQGQF